MHRQRGPPRHRADACHRRDASSSFATNLLIERLGAKNVQRTTESLGAAGMHVLRGVEGDKAFRLGLNNTTTARALMTLMEGIAKGQCGRATRSGASRSSRPADPTRQAYATHPTHPTRHTQLARALSKLGILSRSRATIAIRAGRVRVDGRLVVDPAHLVVPEQVRISVDGEAKTRAAWRTILFHKPRGVVTTRRDPEGRRTVYDVLGDAAQGLNAVGRLDLATSGLLLLTSDTRLANWVTDPVNAVRRVYVVTVRGEVTLDDAQRLPATHAEVRKASKRETHLVVELRSGRNREVRRMFASIGHEVTRLKRVQFGGFEMGDLEPGSWRAVTRDEMRRAFPRAPI